MLGTTRPHAEFMSLRFFPPNGVATLGVLAVIVKARCSFEMVSCVRGVFDDPYSTKVPLWDVHVHFDCAGWGRREDLSSKVLAWLAHHARCLSYVHSVGKASHLRDIFKFETSLCVTGSAHRTLFNPRGTRGAFWMLLKHWQAWAKCGGVLEIIFQQGYSWGAQVQIVETRIFWEVLWWKHLHMKNMQKTMEKTQKIKKQKQKVQTHVPCQASPQTLPMGLNFLFFLVFSRFWPHCKKPWKNKKTKSSDPWTGSGERPGRGHGSELFFVFPLFFTVWPKPRENKKNKKKFRPMSPARPLPRPCPWVWTFCFFWFSRGFGHTAKNHGKTKKQKVQTHGQGLGRGLAGDMGLNFFLFSHCFLQFGQNLEKTKKTKKKSSDPCPLPGLSPDLAHGSELFVFLIFSRFWPNCKKHVKTKKTKQKVQTHVSCQASLQTLSMGLNLLFLFLCFWFFQRFFLHVFHVNMLSSQYLSKTARFYNLHTCAPQAKLHG